MRQQLQPQQGKQQPMLTITTTTYISITRTTNATLSIKYFSIYDSCS